MYHQPSDVTSRIVTIQFPSALVVLDYGKMQVDQSETEAWLQDSYPTILVVSDLRPADVAQHIGSFESSLLDVFSAIAVDAWSEEVRAKELENPAQYFTTFIRLPKSGASAPRVRGEK